MNLSRNITVKISEVQDKNRTLKVVRKKQHITYKGKPIKIIADFSTQTLKTKRAGSEVFQALKKKKKKQFPTQDNMSCKTIFQN